MMEHLVGQQWLIKKELLSVIRILYSFFGWYSYYFFIIFAENIKISSTITPITHQRSC